MSKPKRGRYLITVEGEYFCATEKGNELKPYRETVPMDQEMAKQWERHFKHDFAPLVFKASKYPGYQNVLSTHLVKAVPLDGQELVLALMNRQQLEDYLDFHALPVQSQLYDSRNKLQGAIENCLADQDMFLEHQRELAKRQGPKADNQSKAAALLASMEGLSAAAEDLPPEQPKPSDKGKGKAPVANSALGEL